jgi:hypothetical protein
MYAEQHRHCHAQLPSQGQVCLGDDTGVTSLRAGQIPSVVLEKFEHVPELHRAAMS